jgi:hypothetical protein
MIYRSAVKCLVCKIGEIIVEAKIVPNTPQEFIPRGPGAKKCYGPALGDFHCDNCQLVYHYPPGKPELVDRFLTKARHQYEDGELKPS